MRSAGLPSLLLLCISLACSPPSPPKTTKADTPADDMRPPVSTPERTTLGGQPGKPHTNNATLAHLQVHFDSTLTALERQSISPDQPIPLAVSFCNTGDAPMDGVLVKVVIGSFASPVDPTFNGFAPLPASLLPAGVDCADSGQAFRLALTLKNTGTLRPGQGASLSPIVVVQWRDAVETYECPFKFVIRQP